MKPSCAARVAANILQITTHEANWEPPADACREQGSLVQLRETVVSHMRQLKNLLDLVGGFFHAPTTRYARA